MIPHDHIKKPIPKAIVSDSCWWNTTDELPLGPDHTSDLLTPDLTSLKLLIDCVAAAIIRDIAVPDCKL